MNRERLAARLSDEDLGSEIKGALLMDAPGNVSSELRTAVAAIPDEPPAVGAGGRRRFATLRSALAAAAAIAVIAASIGLGWTLRGTTAGPGPSVITASASPAPGHIYWANTLITNTSGSTTMGRANLDGTGVNQSFITGANNMGDVAIVGDHIYWSGYASYTIGRANRDGSGVNGSFIDLNSSPSGLASDGTYLYWANPDDSAIGRANLDGTGANESFISGTGDGPIFVAISAGYIYWAEYGNGAIGRAKLDGTDVEKDFITGITGAAAVAMGPAAIAFNDGYIYWTRWNFQATSGGAIGRAKLDGTEVNQTFVGGDFNPRGLAIAGGYFYWSNPGTPDLAAPSVGSIGRAKLDGTEVNQGFIMGASGPTGLAIGA